MRLKKKNKMLMMRGTLHNSLSVSSLHFWKCATHFGMRCRLNAVSAVVIL